MSPEAKRYMGRRCLCSHERAHHHHGHTPTDKGELKLSCVPCGLCGCQSFVDEFERELGGNPMENPHFFDPEIPETPAAN